jgi:hypothetical protein
MVVTLSQEGHDCPLSVTIGGYAGMGEMSAALKAGMTPIVSYWSAPDMLWMDGKGQDGQGACQVDTPDACGKATRFYNFSIEDIPSSSHCGYRLTGQSPAPPKAPKTTTAPPKQEPEEHPAETALLPGLLLGIGSLVAALVLAGLLAFALVQRRRRRLLAEASSGELPQVAAARAQQSGSLERGRPSAQGLLSLVSGGARQLSSQDLRALECGQP